MALTVQAKNVVKYVTAQPFPHVIILLHMGIFVAGIWYVTEYAVPKHWRLVSDEIDKVLASHSKDVERVIATFEADQKRDEARHERLLEIIEADRRIANRP